MSAFRTYAVGVTDTPPPARSSGNQSVERAFALLEVLADSGEGLSVIEAARAASLDRTITHRLLKTLADLDVCTVARGRYELGPAALRLGYSYADRLPFRRLALAAAIDITRGLIHDRPWIVSFSAPMGARLAIIDRIWHPGVPLNALIDVGTQLALDGSTQGRAMLACMSDEEITRRIGQVRAAKVADRLRVIRERDYVESEVDELMPGLFAVATAIKDEHGTPLGAITISGQYLDEDLGPSGEIGQLVKRTARYIEQSIPRSRT
jgi:DNA-binding IclR family transcriptional regulator